MVYIFTDVDRTDDQVLGDIWFIRLLKALLRTVIMEKPQKQS